MKKETKASIIIFCVVLILAYVIMCFIPDEVLTYSTQNSSVINLLGDITVATIGMRGVLAFAMALITTLLVRIVDPEEKASKAAKSKTKNKTQKQNKETK